MVETLKDPDFEIIGATVERMLTAAGELTVKQWMGTLASIVGQMAFYGETEGTVIRKDGGKVYAEEMIQNVQDGALAMLADARDRAIREKAAAQEDAEVETTDALADEIADAADR